VEDGRAGRLCRKPDIPFAFLISKSTLYAMFPFIVHNLLDLFWGQLIPSSLQYSPSQKAFKRLVNENGAAHLAYQ
jgi:hypothetical protein